MRSDINIGIYHKLISTILIIFGTKPCGRREWIERGQHEIGWFIVVI